MYSDLWQASTPAITNNDQPAAVVPRLPCPNKLESCAQPDNVFVEQGNISEKEIFTRNSFAGLSNNFVQSKVQ